MKQEKDKNGFYLLSKEYTEELLNNEGIYPQNNSEITEVQEDIWRIWKNQKEPLTNEVLNKDSLAENNLAFKHFVFAEQYLTCSNITKICENLNISRPTAYEWLKRDDIQNYLQERRREIETDAKQIYANTLNACFSTLSDMITTDFGIDNTDRIRAIDTFLKHYENIERINMEKQRRN